MINIHEQLTYINSKLAFLKSKVELDNEQGLYDINKISEHIFMHLLNCTFDLHLEDANNILYANYPAIDLIDHENKLVVQVTSTITTAKIYSSYEKLKKLNKFSSYKLKMCYISNKPNFSDTELKNIKNKTGLIKDDLLSIHDINNKAQSDINKRKEIYNIIFQRIDSKAINFDIEYHFEKFETELNSISTKKFIKYNNDFINFLQSKEKIFAISAIGGHGKSHLLKHLALMKTDYTPVIFTKSDNVELDLKLLDPTIKYLFFYDDIDRFIESTDSIFSYIINHPISKLVISFRNTSISIVEEKICRHNGLRTVPYDIFWNEDEIYELIKLIKSDISEERADFINKQFNSNPFLITQALKGNLEELKDFTKRLVIDSKNALKKFSLNESEIHKILFKVAILTPCSFNDLEKDEIKFVKELNKVGIFRTLVNKIRFNSDIIGDLYLSSYIKTNDFKDILDDYNEEIQNKIITNLSYSFTYEDNEDLKKFFKSIIRKWEDKENYKTSNLKLLSRVAHIVPLETFLYLKKVTNKWPAKENEHIKTAISEFIPQTNYYGDFNTSDTHINLGSIIPLLNLIVKELKYEKNCGKLKIKHIIEFLVSKKVQSLKKPYYVNHEVSNLFDDLMLPKEESDNLVILEALNEIENWIKNKKIDAFRLNLIKSSFVNLLNGRVFYYDATEQIVIEFNTSNPKIKIVFDKVHEILLYILSLNDNNLIYLVFDILKKTGGYNSSELSESNIQYYKKITTSIFRKLEEILITKNDFIYLSKFEELLIDSLIHKEYKDLAFELLRKFERTPLYKLNQIFINSHYIIFNEDKFFKEFPVQTDLYKWLQTNFHLTRYSDLSENEELLYHHFAQKIKNPTDLINLFNSLYFPKADEYELFNFLKYLLANNTSLFDQITNNMQIELVNKDVENILNNFLLIENVKKLKLSDISKDTKIPELLIYTTKALNNCDFKIYKKIFKIFKEIDNKKELKKFIEHCLFNIHTLIKKDFANFEIYKEIIYLLFNSININKFIAPFYLTNIIELLIQNNINNVFIEKEILKYIYISENNHVINILDNELEIYFKYLNYTSEDIIARIFLKCYIFAYQEHLSIENIHELNILYKYIVTYEDFSDLMNSIFYYYENFSQLNIINNKETWNSIDLRFFFFRLNEQGNKIFKYLNKFINELLSNKKTNEINGLIPIIPINDDFIDSYSEIINFSAASDYNDEILNHLKSDILEKDKIEEIVNSVNIIHRNEAYKHLTKTYKKYISIFYDILIKIDDLDFTIRFEDFIKEQEETVQFIEEMKLEFSMG